MLSITVPRLRIYVAIRRIFGVRGGGNNELPTPQRDCFAIFPPPKNGLMSRVQLHHMVKKPTSHNVSPTCLQQKETPNVRCSHRGEDEAQKIKRDILRDAEVTGSHECKEAFSFMVTRNVDFV